MPKPGRQVYLATCNRRPSDLSSLARPRIPRALTLHHIHELSPCCCCAALPPEDTYKTQRKSELSVPAPNTNLLATRISGPQKYPVCACCTLPANTGTLKTYQKTRQTISTAILVALDSHSQSEGDAHRSSQVGILTDCFCNVCCPPCMLSQVKFLFLIHKAEF